VNWDDLGGESSGGGNRFNRKEINYVKIQENATSRLRLVGNPVMCLKHWKPIMATSPGEGKDVCWDEGGHKPKKQYSIWVIDRADGQMKVLDFGATLLKAFKGYKKLKGKDPGGPEGPDWLITKEIPSEKNESGQWVKNKRNTTYQAMKDEVTPFTDAELEMIQQTTEKYPLRELRRADKPEWIAELYEEYKNNPDGPVPGSGKWWQARREAKAAAKEAGGNVEFDDEHTSDVADAPAQPQGGTSAPAPDAEAPAAEGDSSGDFEDLFDEKSQDESAGLF